MEKLLLQKSGKKLILLGNEAIVRGALEAGVNFVSTYPGTPASEIGNIFSKIAKDIGVYFEISTNEKVALEAAIGASFSGLKCLIAMKSFGLNVCSDALLPFVYTGVNGPTVIVVADDPSCWSSAQSEENSRAYAYLVHIPILEPADSQEAKDFTKLAFEISEKFKLPVIIRTTTRVAHQRAPVKLGKIVIGRTHGFFRKEPRRFVTMPPRVLEMKKELLEKIEKIREFAEKTNRDPISVKSSRDRVSVKLGIITSGVSYLYVKEVLEELELDVPVLKLGFFYPLPEKKIKNFIKNLKKVLVVEELEGFLEKEVAILARQANPKLEIYGKDLLPAIGELNQLKVGCAIAKILNKKLKIKNSLKSNPPGSPLEGVQEKQPFGEFLASLDSGKSKIPKRFPRFCPGCPYWFVFSVIKKIAPENTIFGGDIGCYMLASLPPCNISDYLSCMGSSIGIGHGIKKALQYNSGKIKNQKVIAFIGDSTFFHAGIPALINTVFNKSNPLIIILDNQTTAMTGHQTNPGIGKTGMGEITQKIKIEDIVSACGVKNVKVIDPININEFQNAVKEFLNKDEVSVIVARRICALLARKQK